MLQTRTLPDEVEYEDRAAIQQCSNISLHYHMPLLVPLISELINSNFLTIITKEFAADLRIWSSKVGVH